MTSQLVPWRGHHVPILSDEIARDYSFSQYVRLLNESRYGYASPMAASGYTTTYGTRRAEAIATNFPGFVEGLLYSDGPVSAAEAYRLRVFGQAPLLYQEVRDGRPGDLSDDTRLSLVRRPWTGATLSDLGKRALLHGDFGGNAYGVEIDDELILLRPDWVEIVLAKRMYGGQQVGWKQVGIAYTEDGIGRSDPAVFMPGEYFHFIPGLPDPLASYRGMSWLTPLIREVQADKAASDHKLAFFENAASPNLAVSMPKELTPQQVKDFVEQMDSQHRGTLNAYKTLYMGGGADVTVIGANMQQMDFSSVQGKGETRIANGAGVPPVLLSFSEGMGGSSLNAGNYQAAKRNFVDTTMRDLWQNWCGSLSAMAALKPKRNHRLWYDARDIPFLHEDQKDAAEIQQTKATTINTLITAGFVPDTVVASVDADDRKLLKHSGLTSVQLVAPGTDTNGDGAPDDTASAEAESEAGDEYAAALEEFRAQLWDERDEIVRAGFDEIERKYYDVRFTSGPKGGQFRKISDRVGAALNDYLSGDGGGDDPLEPFTQPQLKQAAKDFGITMTPRAGKAALKLAIFNDAKSRHKAKRAEPKRRASFTLKGEDRRDLDVGVYVENKPNSKIFLRRESDGKPGTTLVSFDDLDGLASWADEHGEAELGTWARQEKAGVAPATDRVIAPSRRKAAAEKAEAKKAGKKAAPKAESFDARLKAAATGADALDAAPAHFTQVRKRGASGRADDMVGTGGRLQIPGVADGETQELADALYGYQGADFEHVNDWLRGTPGRHSFLGRWSDEDIEAHRPAIEAQVAKLDRLMEASALASDSVVWRGSRTGRGTFGDRLDGDLTGFEWTDDAYTSTSVSEEAATRFAGQATEAAPGEFHRSGVLMRVVVPEGTGAVNMSGIDVGGANIGGTDASVSEGELLLQRGLGMRVVADHGVGPDGMRRLDVEAVRPKAAKKATPTKAPPGPDRPTSMSDLAYESSAKKATPRKAAPPAPGKAGKAPQPKAPLGPDIETTADVRDLPSTDLLQGSYLTPTGRAALEALGPAGHPRIAAISDTEGKIREAFRMLAVPGQGTDHHVALADLRKLIGEQVSRESLDAELKRMDRLPDVRLEPQSYARENAATRIPAAVTIGGQENNLIHIDDPRLSRPKQFAAVTMAEELLDRQTGGRPVDPMMSLLTDADLKAEIDARADRDPLVARDLEALLTERGVASLPAGSTTPDLSSLDTEARRDALDMHLKADLLVMIRKHNKGLPPAQRLKLSGTKRELVDRLVEGMDGGPGSKGEGRPRPTVKPKGPGTDLATTPPGTLSQDELVALKLLSAKGWFADGGWINGTGVTAMHREQLDKLAEKGWIQKHVTPSGESQYRIDPRSAGTQRANEEAAEGDALVGDIVAPTRAPESRLSVTKVNRGAIIEGYRDPGDPSTFANVPEDEADESRVMRLVVQRVESLDEDGNPATGFLAVRRRITGHDTETGQRVTSELVSVGSQWSWVMNPDTDTSPDIEGEIVQAARAFLDQFLDDEILRMAVDGDEFQAYWTRGKGLKRWSTKPHPWTTLHRLLLKHPGIHDAEGLASHYFHVVFGIWPGERKGDNPVGPG